MNHDISWKYHIIISYRRKRNCEINPVSQFPHTQLSTLHFPHTQLSTLHFLTYINRPYP